MESLSPTRTTEQIATDLLARSLRAWFDAQGADGLDAYQLGLRDAYREAATLALETTGSRVRGLAAELEDAVSLDCRRSAADRTAARVVHEAMVGSREGTGHLEWVGPLAFRRRYPGPPGVDHDYGDDWGELADQRVSWRAGPGATEGLLYAYDPTWEEYASIAVDVSKETAGKAVAAARARDSHPDVESLLHALNAPAPAAPKALPPPVALQPEL